MFFSFSFFCLTGDDSVNAGGLDIAAAVAFAIVASAIASLVVVDDAYAATSVVAAAVVVVLFWGGWGFLLLRITWVHPSSLLG